MSMYIHVYMRNVYMQCRIHFFSGAGEEYKIFFFII